MKYIIIAVFLFACKSKKDIEREAAIKWRDSTMATYPTYRPMPLLPALGTPYYSIEERELDTVIALLKKQNKLLKIIVDQHKIQATQFNGSFEYLPIDAGTINMPPAIFTPVDTTHKKIANETHGNN